MPSFRGHFYRGMYGRSINIVLDSTGGFMARTSRIGKQALTIFLAFVLHFTAFTNAYASASSLGGWSITDRIRQGAATAINASKNVVINGANVVKTSTALIRPAVSQVSKVLVRGAGGYALAVAVEQLLGAVDWVLDPENNRVKYTVPSSDPESPSNEFFYVIPYNGYNTSKFASPDSACRYAFAAGLADPVKSSYPYYSHAANGSCYLTNTAGEKGNFVFSEYVRVANPVYDSEQDQERSIPLDVVSQKIIDNADSSTDSDVKAGAQVVSGTAADDALANDAATQADARQQLETNARTQTSEQAQAESTPKDPAKPELGSDISLQFPVFCGWAPTVCEAAQTVISFPITLTNWWTTATTSITEAYELAKTKAQELEDYFKEEPEPNNDTELPIDAIPAPDVDTNINFGGSCPAPISVPINFAFVNTTLEFNYVWFCQLADFIRPIVYALSTFTAALIIGGVRQED